FDDPLRVADMVSLAVGASPLGDLGDRCGALGAHAHAVLAAPADGRRSSRAVCAIAVSLATVKSPGGLAYRRVTAVRDLPPLRRLGGGHIGRQSGSSGDTIHRKGIRAETLFPCRLSGRLSGSPANRR